MMHGRGKSDFAIVAVKPANKVARPVAEQSAAEPSAAEPVERRAETKGNAGQHSTYRTQRRASVSQTLERIRQTFAVVTRGKSRMRESCMYGSVRGAPSNGRPYRDRVTTASHLSKVLKEYIQKENVQELNPKLFRAHGDDRVYLGIRLKTKAEMEGKSEPEGKVEVKATIRLVKSAGPGVFRRRI
jgi:erythromycin esterase-like protein